MAATLLIVAAPILLVVSVLWAFFTWIGRSYSAGAGLQEWVTISVITVALAVGPGVMLLVIGLIRRSTGRPRSLAPLVVGALCAGLGLVTAVPMAVTAIAEQGRVSELQSTPLTAEETNWTPDELAALVDEFLADSTGTLTDVKAAPQQAGLYHQSCVLGNLSVGTSLAGVEEYLTSDDAETALSAIRAQWEAAGFVVHDDNQVDDHPAIRTDDRDFVQDAAAYWVPGREDYNIAIEISTRCVVD